MADSSIPPLKPLYGPDDAPGRHDPLRGAAGWDIRAEVRRPSEALEALEGGATSLLLKTPEVEAALQGVVLEAAAAALDAGFAGPEAARRLAAAGRGSPSARLALHLDPLSAFAGEGRSPGPIAAHLERAAAAALAIAETYPAASLMLASGRAAHEAGGTPAQELGMMAAAALAYAKALDAAGAPPAQAFPRIALGLSVSGEHLVSLAKLRAARLIWARLTGACDVSAPVVIEARSSERMLAGTDPWTNLLRLTAAGFAGAVGGADAVVLGGFTDALGAPDQRTRRLSRNIQLILRDEAGLAVSPDPGAGAWAIEAVTLELARAGWAELQAIESEGGLVEALKRGRLARDVAAQAAAEAEAVAQDQRPILGVTLYPDPHPGAVAVEPETAPDWPDARLEGPDGECPPLTPVRLSAAAEGRAA